MNFFRMPIIYLQSHIQLVHPVGPFVVKAQLSELGCVSELAGRVE